ncbi:hypothetical protein C2R22_13525 [Salinigranum rubrum]|uniref:DUF4129 domain-containing protein n=1 Tax=Salinigranum rubrum TaxID=755307 RepID=A0A2I8VKS0_9EURY|nr:hypothetical protein [Salinigranum rubrum]AUV82533.1 hypothetical protein C2R22_13525 [Salinigranum rubrum]
MGRYVELSEETPGESDDQTAEQLKKAATDQRQLANQLEDLSRTRERYREARQEGNESGARELARQLQRTADDLEQTRGELVSEYDQISNRTSVDLSDDADLVNETVAQRTAEVEQIQNAEFEPTSLTVETTSSSTNVSFTNPVQLRGQLTASGEPLGDRSIQLEIGAQRIEAETDDDGRFTTEYRPITLPLGTQQVDVVYVPQNESDYQRSNDTVGVTISQVTPDVTASSNVSTARFNDTVQVSVEVSADDVAVPAAPVSMFVGGERVTTNTTTEETDETGQYTKTVRVPLELAVDEQPIRVAVGNSTSAIGRTQAQTNITLLPTNASLVVETIRVNASATGPERRAVITRGRLATANGVSVGGQSVEIAVGGIPVTTVQTDENGRFNTTIQVPSILLPSTAGGEEAIEVTAIYDNEDTNLEDTTATSSILFQAELLNVVGRNLSWSRTIAAFLVLGSAVALRRRYDRAKVEEVPDTAMASQGSGPNAGDDPDDAALLKLADRWLEAGRTSVAVQFAYAAARARFVEAYDVSATKTHWEFYQVCRAVSGEDLNDLERLTALYERAAFAGEPVERATAGEAYLLAEQIRDALDAETAAGTETRAVTDSDPRISRPESREDN